MSKIICDICGTSYPSSAECCPICGCSSTAAAELLGADVQQEDFMEAPAAKTGSVPRKSRKKEIFDFDEADTDKTPPAEEEEPEYEEEEEAPRHNTFAVILLTVLIVALLGAAAFIFLRYFLPNMGQEETMPATVAIQEEETTEAATEATIPCQQMVMTNAGEAKLNAQGQQFLLHIKALPENTTDKIVYTSGDESIATVTEDGKITAVSEGETTIYISCGKHSIECTVTVEYVEETVPPTTEAVVEETVDETTDTEVAEDTEEDVDESSDDNGNNASSTVNSNITLKLKKTDIRLAVYYEFQLELDCELAPEDVTWSSEHPYIATVDEKGNVTAVKEGTTSIIAKYGDQEVQCIVRCVGL